MRFRSIINIAVRLVHRARQTPSLSAPCRLRSAELRSASLGGFHTRLDNGFHGHFTGHFAVRLAAHAVREHEEIQRFDNAEAVLVIRAHPPQIGDAAAYDPHKFSRCCLLSEPVPTPVPGNPVLTLADPFWRRKAVTLTDYLVLRAIAALAPPRGYNQTGRFVPMFLLTSNPLGVSPARFR